MGDKRTICDIPMCAKNNYKIIVGCCNSHASNLLLRRPAVIFPTRRSPDGCGSCLCFILVFCWF